MKILVYGAGVLGSYLTHVLCSDKSNDVTLLAREKRGEIIKNNGLIIRHSVQMKTTVDYVKVISELLPDDRYDIIFVVMQYTHLQSVIPILAQNVSQTIVFVGNNFHAIETEKQLNENTSVKKKVLFGFQSSGGRREGNKIVSFHISNGMIIGASDGNKDWLIFLKEAFKNTKYKLSPSENIDSWLKTHIAFIMPLCYLTYACDGNLHKSAHNKALINKVVTAIDEAYCVLETTGYPITPASDADYIRKTPKKCYNFIKLMAITPIGRLAISDHAMSAHAEMSALSDAIDGYKTKSNCRTPCYDELESYLRSYEQKMRESRTIGV